MHVTDSLRRKVYARAIERAAGDVPARKPPGCAFCSGPAERRCSWPMMKQESVKIELAEVGDLWITEQAAKRARIVQIEDLDRRGNVTEEMPDSRRIWILIPGHPDPYPYKRWPGNRYVTELLGTCDAPACDSHSREVGDDVHYCQAHWRAWELVA